MDKHIGLAESNKEGFKYKCLFVLKKEGEQDKACPYRFNLKYRAHRNNEKKYLDKKEFKKHFMLHSDKKFNESVICYEDNYCTSDDS